MPNIVPISDLRNYGSVLEQVKEGSPVYLTKNGRGMYVIRLIEEDDLVEQLREEAMGRLLKELDEGIRSGEETGWHSKDDVLAHFRRRKEEAE